MAQERKRLKRPQRPIVRREPADDPAEAVERLIPRRQLIVEAGDVMIVREPAGVFRQRADLSTQPTASNSQYRVSVHGRRDDRGRVFVMYDRAVMDGEAIAAARRVRLFYVENAGLTLLKDYRPAVAY
jgi:hypothetical protein